MYVPDAVPQPLEIVNSFGPPPSFSNGPTYPAGAFPPQPFAQTPQRYGPQPVNYPVPSRFVDTPADLKEAEAVGNKDSTITITRGGHQNGLPKPPP
jgi:hypothetical protein